MSANVAAIKLCAASSGITVSGTSSLGSSSICATLKTPHGSRAKLGEAFVADLYADWQKHGPVTITKVRETRPADYLKLIASILPKDVNMNVSPFEHMTDAELEALIARLLAERDDGAEREGPPSTEH